MLEVRTEISMSSGSHAAGFCWNPGGCSRLSGYHIHLHYCEVQTVSISCKAAYVYLEEKAVGFAGFPSLWDPLKSV